MKKILMIHEWKDSYKELPLEDYILTFDDGLHSQYSALEYLKTLNTPKIFFISSGIVCPEYQYQSTEFITSSEAHKKAFEFNPQNFMTWEQILEIHNTENCEIGGHSHSHKHLNKIEKLKDKVIFFKEDTDLMIKKFNLYNIKIEKYCLPYNYNNGINVAFLNRYGFEIYGDERIDIESLI